MLVAIDRTSKFAFVELHERGSRRTAADLGLLWLNLRRERLRCQPTDVASLPVCTASSDNALKRTRYRWFRWSRLSRLQTARPAARPIGTSLTVATSCPILTSWTGWSTDEQEDRGAGVERTRRKIETHIRLLLGVTLVLSFFNASLVVAGDTEETLQSQKRSSSGQSHRRASGWDEARALAATSSIIDQVARLNSAYETVPVVRRFPPAVRLAIWLVASAAAWAGIFLAVKWLL